MKQKLLSFLNWNYHTGAWLALPIMFLIELALAQALVFTAACQTTGFACEYGISADKLVATYAGVMLTLNDGEDYIPNVTGKKQVARR